MSWLRDKVEEARTLVGLGFIAFGYALQPDKPDLDEKVEVDEPAPPQNPVTKDTLTLVGRKTRWRTGPMKEEPEPPLQGSARERYLRKVNGRI